MVARWSCDLLSPRLIDQMQICLKKLVIIRYRKFTSQTLLNVTGKTKKRLAFNKILQNETSLNFSGRGHSSEKSIWMLIRTTSKIPNRIRSINDPEVVTLTKVCGNVYNWDNMKDGIAHTFPVLNNWFGKFLLNNFIS